MLFSGLNGEEYSLAAAFLMGLAGSTHCLSMCGGVHSLLSNNTTRALFSTRKPTTKSQDASLISSDSVVGYAAMADVPTYSFWLQSVTSIYLVILFSLGRVISYALAGLVFGSLAYSIGVLTDDFVQIARFLSGVVLIVIAMHNYNVRDLFRLEYFGNMVWKPLSSVMGDVFPLRKSHHAFLAGMVWGWIPCGMVYSVLAWSILQVDPIQSAVLMLCFGLGTLPMMIFTGVSINNVASRFGRLMSAAFARQIMATILLLFAIWTIVNAYQNLSFNTKSSGDESHHSHGF